MHMAESAIRLGLIGDKIAESRAPELHVTAGRLCGLPVTYELLRPGDRKRTFEEVLAHCREEGYRGVNVTYPYKERAVRHLAAADPAVEAVGACNTVLFERGGPRGCNTDYSGFIAAFRKTFGDLSPGRVALAGAGGVGRAIAFALAKLGAVELRLFDLDREKSRRLAEALGIAREGLRVNVCTSIEEAASGAAGLVNATPIGMAGVGGCPFPDSLIAGQHWAFDAVYTPAETAFTRATRAAGVSTMSGSELFLYQGIHAFRSFTGHDVDEERLRDALKLLHDGMSA